MNYSSIDEAFFNPITRKNTFYSIGDSSAIQSSIMSPKDNVSNEVSYVTQPPPQPNFCGNYNDYIAHMNTCSVCRERFITQFLGKLSPQMTPERDITLPPSGSAGGTFSPNGSAHGTIFQKGSNDSNKHLLMFIFFILLFIWIVN